MDVCTTNRRMATGISRAVVNGLENNRLTYSGNRLVVLFSGGGDSVALLAAIVEIRGPENVFAFHANYALRGQESDADEQFCREFCERLGVSLHVERAPRGFADEPGNLQDRARIFRYVRAAHLAAELGGAQLVTAHTADDQAETLLYRLFASPGRDSLGGMAEDPQRPFLILRRADLRDWCRERGLEWREDSSNRDPRFARVRARKLLADAESLHPSALKNFLTTMDELREETAALDVVVDQLVDDLMTEAGLSAEGLSKIAPALAKRVLRRFVERNGSWPVWLKDDTVEELLRLAAAGGSSEVQFEGGAVLVEYGFINPKDPVDYLATAVATTLPIPGEARFGEWVFESDELARSGLASDFSAELPVTEAADELIVRARRPGDRIRPRGLDGSKSLQDLFVDAKVPRRLREAHPVVCEGERIVWVPGLAVAEPEPAAATAVVSVHATRLN